jgi:hypothetical protein
VPALAASEVPRERKRFLPSVNIIDKLLAAEQAIRARGGRWAADPVGREELWIPEYQRVYGKFQFTVPESVYRSNDKVLLAIALGIKATDGVIALKARDVAGLNDCAVQIDKLAIQLAVPEKYVQRANAVKVAANRKRWVEAFSELGRLQTEVMAYLEDDAGRRDDALFVIVGAWLQGGACFTDIIAENYTPYGSGVLREPKLVRRFSDELKSLKEETRSHKAIAAVIDFLPAVFKTVNIGFEGSVPLDGVKGLHDGFVRIRSGVFQ